MHTKHPGNGSDFVVLSGNSNVPLAREVCEYLKQPLGKSSLTRFSDGEIQAEIGENVRGRDVFLMQSTSTPVNDHLMELLILPVLPRTPITARLVADLITSAGADRFVSMDLHAGQIQGFFDMPSDHLYASPVLVEHMKKAFPNPEDVVIVSPDAGGVERARAYAKRLGTALAIVDKRRSKPNVAEVMNLIGDVRGKVGVLLDDMVDTAGTLTQGAKALMDHGAKRVLAYAVHPVLSGPAIQRISESVIEQLVVTNTIPLSPAARDSKKIVQLSVGRIFGEAIRRIYSADSLSSLFV